MENVVRFASQERKLVWGDMLKNKTGWTLSVAMGSIFT